MEWLSCEVFFLAERGGGFVELADWVEAAVGEFLNVRCACEVVFSRGVEAGDPAP